MASPECPRPPVARRAPPRLLAALAVAWQLGSRWAFAGAPPLRRAGASRQPERCRRICLQSTAEGSDEQRQPVILPERAASSAGKEQGPDGDNVKSAQIQLPLNDKFGLAYTCCKCDTRNAIEVTRIAWDKGVVVATCSGCGARHLLADSEGMLDLTNEMNFRNIVDLMESQGQDVAMLDSSNEELLRSKNLKVDENGKLAVLNQTASVAAASDQEPVIEWSPDEGSSDAAAAAPAPPPVIQEEEEVDTAPIVVRLPVDASPREGDTLTIRTDFGLLHVPVPGDATAGCRLEVQGMVEVSLPQKDMPRWVQSDGAGEWQQSEEWKVGDVVAVDAATLVLPRQSASSKVRQPMRRQRFGDAVRGFGRTLPRHSRPSVTPRPQQQQDRSGVLWDPTDAMEV